MTETTATETRTAPHYGVKVGDFFESTWGYDQTNVDFYMVTELTAKRIKIVQVLKGTVKGGDGGPADYVAPLPIPVLDDRIWKYCERCGVEDAEANARGEFARAQNIRFDRVTKVWTCGSCGHHPELPEPKPKVMLKTLRGGYDGTPSFALTSYSYGHLWDCKPAYQTGSGWGH